MTASSAPDAHASELHASDVHAPVPHAPAPHAPVAVLGECVADAFVVPGPEEGQTEGGSASALGLEVLPGGGPANTAVALARLGTPARFLGRLSTDVFGRLFHAHLAASGVDLTHTVQAAEPSTLAVASIDAAGRAEYSFHAEATADWQWTPAELTAATGDPLSCLHTGSLTSVRPPGAEALERLLDQIRPHTTISLDPNVRPHLIPAAAYTRRLARWCAAADILRLSDDDLAQLLPDARPEEAADTLHGYGARLVVITLGPDGAFASLDGERLRVPAPEVSVVDSVGAGDTFTAGLLHSLHSQGVLGGRLDSLDKDGLTAALTFGTRVAAAVCAVRGANPPWAEALEPDVAG